MLKKVKNILQNPTKSGDLKNGETCMMKKKYSEKKSHPYGRKCKKSQKIYNTKKPKKLTCGNLYKTMYNDRTGDEYSLGICQPKNRNADDPQPALPYHKPKSSKNIGEYTSRGDSIKHNFEVAKKYSSMGEVLWIHGIKELMGG